jgi:hypothetical protein
MVSDLTITPSEAKPAEEVVISVMVTNTGGSGGSYTVILRVNNVEEARREIALEAVESEEVTFTIVEQALGSYTVDVNGHVGQFRVVLLPPLPEPTGILPLLPATNWWLIGGIAAGCILIIMLLLLLFARRRRDQQRVL